LGSLASFLRRRHPSPRQNLPLTRCLWGLWPPRHQTKRRARHPPLLSGQLVRPHSVGAAAWRHRALLSFRSALRLSFARFQAGCSRLSVAGAGAWWRPAAACCGASAGPAAHLLPLRPACSLLYTGSCFRCHEKRSCSDDASFGSPWRARNTTGFRGRSQQRCFASSLGSQ